MSKPHNSHTHTDVIVVGAGPVGLFTALALAQQGVEVVVVDREQDVDDTPRAMAFQPCALGEMIEIGIFDEVYAASVKDATISWWKARTDDADHQHLVTIATKDGLVSATAVALAGLNLPQSDLCRIILKHLERYANVNVLWAHSVIDLEQTTESANLTVHHETEAGTAEEKTFTANWVIGADGGSSAIRKLAQVGFEGFTWPKEAFVATNVYYDFEKYGFTSRNFVIDSVNWAIVAKINNEGLWRVAYGTQPDKSDEQVRAELPEHYKYILPGPCQDYRVVRIQKYQPHQRCVTSMRIGRVLLLGDAAHLNNPIGGLGLTTGLLDAGPLARALAAVLSGDAPSSLLDEWAMKRRMAWWNATNTQSIEFKRIAQQGGYGEDPSGIWAKDEVAETSGLLPYLQNATPEAKSRDEALYVALGDPDKQKASRARVWDLAMPVDWMAQYEDSDVVERRRRLRPVKTLPN